MFDYLIKVLPNNRLLVRNSADKTSEVLKADQVSPFFEKLLEAQLEAQSAEDEKAASIKKQSTQTYKEWYEEQRADLDAKKAKFQESKK
jgi:hypothetical protein